MTKCGHIDDPRNKMIYKWPVYKKREDESGILLAWPEPDHYVEREWCIECMVEAMDKVMRPPWWRRVLKGWLSPLRVP